jgi:NTE family protein
VHKVGLVLGAGGLVGQAYHSGVLAALEWDLGWDARSADMVVGTSAGSLTGGMLRMGIPAFDNASWAIGGSWGRKQLLLSGLDAVRSDLPQLDLRLLLRRWHLPAWRLWAQALSRPWAFRPLFMISSMLPIGVTSFTQLAEEHLSGWSDEIWPDGLRICATRRRDGQRVVFGQGEAEADMPSAIAASSAIPAYVAPVVIDGVEYVDGGLHSPTNADLLADGSYDLVIVISPMSGGDGRVDGALRNFARKRLQAEMTQLEKAGTRVVCFQPGRSGVRAMGHNPMAHDRAARVLQTAFFETGAKVADPTVREMLAGITTRRPWREPAEAGTL